MAFFFPHIQPNTPPPEPKPKRPPEPPTKEDLLRLMEVCRQNKSTSWFSEWNLIDLHNAIHAFYGVDEHERAWFNAGTSEVHGDGTEDVA